MAGFEHGEKLVCLEKVKVGSSSFQPGDDFPYMDLNVELGLVDSLLSQRKIARKALLSDKVLDALKVVHVEKIIKNFPDGRVAVSWPDHEPLPEGVIDGRPSAFKAAEQPLPLPEDDPNYDPDLSEEEFGEDPEEETEPEEESETEPETESEEETANIDSGKAASVEIVPADGIGWFNVAVDGIIVNTKRLRKRDAVKLREEYL